MSNYKHQPTNLLVERLEERMMLSTVKIFAAGHTGEESFNLVAGDKTAIFENVGGDVGNGVFEELVLETDHTVSASDIEIVFINDHYDPSTGLDRNLTIDRIEIDGTVFKTASADVYSEGSYQNGNLTSGYGVGNTLYSNGKFEFGANAQDGTALVVHARGTTGDEKFDVIVDSERVGSFSVNDDGSDGSFFLSVNETVSGSDVRIRFTNDLYLPDEGIDRNLVVDRIEVGGQTLQTESPNVYSTGTYVAGIGIEDGTPESETLHANGEFTYYDQAIDGFDFANRIWQRNEALIVSDNSGALGLTTSGGTGVFSTGFDIQAGERFELRADIVRRPPAGVSFDEVGEAFLGVDFFDAHGVEIGEEIFNINTGNPFVDGNFTAPAGTVSGSIWVAIIDAGAQTAEVNFNDLQLTQLNAADTTPPQIEFLDQGFVVTNPVRIVRLEARITDDVELSFSPGDLVVIEPDGVARQANFTFLNSNSTTDRIAEISYTPDQSGGQLSQADNGLYQIELRDGSLRDASGNSVPGGIIGSFEVAIADSLDTTPPEVVLFQTNPTTPSNFDPAFTIAISDSESGISVSTLSDNGNPGTLDQDITVTGSDGTEFSVQRLGGGPSFNGFNLNYVFVGLEGPLPAGEYQVSILDDSVTDNAGNGAAGGVIGTLRFGLV